MFWRDYIKKVTNPNIVLSSTAGQGIGFADYLFINIQRYVSSGQACRKVLGNKNWQEV
jgi:hypothetical protein